MPRALNLKKHNFRGWVAGFVAIGFIVGVMVMFAGSVAQAAPVFKQLKFTQKSGGGSTVTAAFPSANTVGSLIVVSVEWNSAATPTITDSKGNTYTSAGAALTTPSTMYKEQTFYASNVAAGTNTVTATFTGATTSDRLIYAHEYGGMATSSPVDATTSQTGTAAVMSTGSLTTTSANTLLYAVGMGKNQVTSVTPGFTMRSTNASNLTEDQAVTSAGSYSATATQNSNGWSFRMIAFKAAAQVPAAPTSAPDMTAATDTGVSNTDNFTNNATPTFTGSCTDGDTVTILVDGSTIAPTAVCASSTYTITPGSALSSGSRTIKSTFTNASGTSGQSPALTVTIDTTAAAPGITTPADNATVNTTTPSFTGTAEANATVSLTIDSGTPVNTTANGSGSWTYTPSAMSTGSHMVSASQTDVAGNASTSSPTNTFTIDTTVARDPLKQPFSSDSIWNMPIGSDAQYVAANLPSDPGGDPWSPMPQIDDEPIILTPTAPLVAIKHSNAGWSGANRCTGDSQQLAMVPIPSTYTIGHSSDNNSAAILMPDGRTILQSQPFTRCTAGGEATSLLTFPTVDLYGPGITGSHGGSNLSALGGSIRLGELRPGQQGMKHAIKVNVNSTHDLYHCTVAANCFRWPATTADGDAVGNYGTDGNNQNSAMKMGALLAIPASVDIDSLGLESVPGKQLAWTMQNYGAYIADSTGGPAFAIEAETGPDGSLRSQFQADYSMPFEQRVNDNTAWSRDLQRLVVALNVVNNNSPTSIGGGGTPRQPLAPPIAP